MPCRKPPETHTKHIHRHTAARGNGIVSKGEDNYHTRYYLKYVIWEETKVKGRGEEKSEARINREPQRGGENGLEGAQNTQVEKAKSRIATLS